MESTTTTTAKTITLNKKQQELLQSLRLLNEAYYAFGRYLEEIEEQCGEEAKNNILANYEELFQATYNFTFKEMEQANNERVSEYLFEEN